MGQDSVAGLPQVASRQEAGAAFVLPTGAGEGELREHIFQHGRPAGEQGAGDNALG